MIKRTLTLTIVGLVLMMPIKGHAQQMMRLTLAQAQDTALQHNYALMNASLDVKKAEAAKWQTLSSMLPQVSAKFDYQNMCGYEMNFGPMSIPMNPSGSLGITASVALTAQQIMGTLMSDISKEMADINRRQSIQNTMANVKNVYVSILVMEDIVGLLDSSLANMESLERTTQASVAVGAAEQIDADKLSVQVAQMRNTIASNRRSLKMLYNSMLLQLGVDVDTKIELATKLEEIIDIDQVAQLTTKDFDLSKNFSYQLLEKSEQLTKDQLTLAWLGFTPTVSVFYQYSYKTYFGKSEGMNMTPPNMVGASISLPLFQTGTRVAKIKEAKINLQETLNSKKSAEDGLKVQFNQLCYDLVSAIETYQMQKKNLEVTKRVLDNTTEKYKYGRASNLEVTNASTNIITAQSNYIQAVMSVLSAETSLENLLAEEQYTNVTLPGEKSKQ